MIGKDGSKLGHIRAVASSSMQQPAVEEQHVTLIQFGRDFSLQNAAVRQQVCTKKQVAIVLVPAKLPKMGTRHQPYAAVFLVFDPKRKPNRHQLGFLE